jgi:hypothetical protein
MSPRASIPCVVLLASATALQAQSTGAVRGVVRLPSDDPAPGARVALRGVPGPSAATDSAGRFLLGGLPAGRYVIVASRDGNNPGTLAVTVSAGDTAVVALTLGGPVELTEIAVVSAPARPYAADSVTAGSKMPVPLRDLPQTVTVITEGVIRDRNLTSTSRLADNVSGVVPLVGYDGYGLN